MATIKEAWHMRPVSPRLSDIPEKLSVTQRLFLTVIGRNAWGMTRQLCEQAVRVFEERHPEPRDYMGPQRSRRSWVMRSPDVLSEESPLTCKVRLTGLEERFSQSSSTPRSRIASSTVGSLFSSSSLATVKSMSEPVTAPPPPPPSKSPRASGHGSPRHRVGSRNNSVHSVSSQWRIVVPETSVVLDGSTTTPGMVGPRKSLELTPVGAGKSLPVRKRSVGSVFSVGSRSRSRNSMLSVASACPSSLSSARGGLGQVAKLCCHPVELYSDAVPACRSVDQWKSLCLVFLADGRRDESAGDALLELRRRQQEVSSLIRAYARKKMLKGAPALLSVVLVHTPSPHSHSGGIGEHGWNQSWPGDKYMGFVNMVKSMTGAPEEDVIHYSVDFDDPEAFLWCLVRVMSAVVKRRKNGEEYSLDEQLDEQPTAGCHGCGGGCSVM